MSNIAFKDELTVPFQVTDCLKSIAWYQDVLGFKLLYHVEEIGWCEMETHIKNVAVGFSQVEKPKVEGGATLTWGVKDIEAARKEMEEKGVRFDGETHIIPDMVKLATFFDPDGNHLMLAESLNQG